jgi:hypothetical protein
MGDPRIMLTQPLEDWPEGKSQVIDVEEYTKLFPRGSTGKKIVEGSSVVYFDFPTNMVILSSPRNRFDITCVLEKRIGGPSESWSKLTAADAEYCVLVENFIAHAFSKIEFQINHMPATTDGYVKNGQGLYESFVLSHLREDAKLQCVSSEQDPAFQTYLKASEWKSAPSGTTNKWSEYLGKIKDKRFLKVNYRPFCFPFQLAAPTEQKTFVVPAMGQQLTMALYLDTTYQNVFTIHGTPPAPPPGADASPPSGVGGADVTPAPAAVTTTYRFHITSMELNVAYARMSALGERALMEKPRASLAQYPGMYVKQYPIFNTTGDQQAIINLPDVALPSHVLIQAFSPDVMTTGKPATAEVRTRAIAHQLGEVVMKFDDQVFYVSPINPGKVGDGDEDMKLLMRRNFFEKPFFQMPCHPDIGKGNISKDDYSHPHVIFDMSNGARQRMQTLNAGPDPRKGKFTLVMKAEGDSGLCKFYMITLIYAECGVIIDRQSRNYVSSYFAL